MEELSSISLQTNASILSNIITDCMMQNGMTLENLDDACTHVRELFRTDATIKKAD
ncbi:MAG: hypothetical protein PHD70_14225 [Anaerostipes sp.]|jgi:hypothetical protein|nr:hypothetical protein [Anaerostipes sp.]MDD3747615.1 hypothetical protein [Anaerostipes sp.]